MMLDVLLAAARGVVRTATEIGAVGYRVEANGDKPPQLTLFAAATCEVAAARRVAPPALKTANRDGRAAVLFTVWLGVDIPMACQQSLGNNGESQQALACRRPCRVLHTVGLDGRAERLGARRSGARTTAPPAVDGVSSV